MTHPAAASALLTVCSTAPARVVRFVAVPCHQGFWEWREYSCRMNRSSTGSPAFLCSAVRVVLWYHLKRLQRGASGYGSGRSRVGRGLRVHGPEARAAVWVIDSAHPDNPHTFCRLAGSRWAFGRAMNGRSPVRHATVSRTYSLAPLFRARPMRSVVHQSSALAFLIHKHHRVPGRIRPVWAWVRRCLLKVILCGTVNIPIITEPGSAFHPETRQAVSRRLAFIDSPWLFYPAKHARRNSTFGVTHALNAAYLSPKRTRNSAFH